MKKVFATALLLAVFLPFSSASARNAHQSVHFENNLPYDCSTTKSPSKPDWLDYRQKKDKLKNKKIVLIWEDADRAHDVEIMWRAVGGKWKVVKTGDDGENSFKNLKNGTFYEFKMRGFSNCGKSGWTKAYKFLP